MVDLSWSNAGGAAVAGRHGPWFGPDEGYGWHGWT